MINYPIVISGFNFKYVIATHKNSNWKLILQYCSKYIIMFWLFKMWYNLIFNANLSQYSKLNFYKLVILNFASLI